MSVSIEEVKN